ncbi:MAG: ATP-binding protein [Candidatus Hodarchaeota archaeon]
MSESNQEGKIYRDIIKIDEELCTGCGLCAEGCPEGAIQIIDGKARLVSDLLCDGLGACIGDCPEGAISIEKREAEVYDERKVMSNIVMKGANTIKAHLLHLKHHDQTEYFNQAVDYLNEKGIDVPDVEEHEEVVACHTQPSSCPGSRMIDLRSDSSGSDTQVTIGSELQNWPIQLKLMNPNAPYLKGADLLIAADCVGFSNPNLHQQYLKGKILTILCPKLDSDIENYVNKLAHIFQNQDIKSITTLHMQVPCCFGINSIIENALKRSGKSIPVTEKVISIQGTEM